MPDVTLSMRHDVSEIQQALSGIESALHVVGQSLHPENAKSCSIPAADCAGLLTGASVLVTHIMLRADALLQSLDHIPG